MNRNSAEQKKTSIAACYTGNQEFSLNKNTICTPSAGQVRIRVAWCGICGTDMHIFHGKIADKLFRTCYRKLEKYNCLACPKTTGTIFKP